MKVIAVIPAYNEEKTIAGVIAGIKKYAKHIIVIDDGSRDKTGETAKQEGVKVLRHAINIGLGGALGTGLKAAIMDDADVVITLDADGQHSPEDIPLILEPIIKNEADFVVGSRFLKKQKMPVFRKVANGFANFTTFVFWGARSSDTQSGMRAFSKYAVKKIEILSNGMEVSSEIIKEAKQNKLRVKEVPIRAIYTDYSLSKGQGFIPGIKTFLKLIILKLTQ